MSHLLLTCLVVFALLGHGYLWVDVANTFHAVSWPRKLVDGVTLLCLLLFLTLPLVFVFYWSDLGLLATSPTQTSLVLPSLVLLRSYFYLCVGWGVTKLILSAIYRAMADHSSTLQDWRQDELDLASRIGPDTLIGGFSRLLGKVPANQLFQLTVDHKRLAIPQLSAQHEGLRIAHLSDLHMTGRIGPQWFDAVAEQVNQLQPDVIAITGDIIEHESCWPWLATSLGTLKAKCGVYFILGNHDFYIDVQRTRQLLEEHGLICLSNQTFETQWNEAPIVLAGNEKPWSKTMGDLTVLTPKGDDPLPLRLALMHSPDQFAWASQHNFDLALAGHTHGGQIRFPILGPIVCPSRFGTRYACGVFRRGNTVMHVTRGVSGKTPLRWNCLPEIALLELACG